MSQSGSKAIKLVSEVLDGKTRKGIWRGTSSCFSHCISCDWITAFLKKQVGYTVQHLMVCCIYHTNSLFLFFPNDLWEWAGFCPFLFYPIQLLSPWVLVTGVKLVLTPAYRKLFNTVLFPSRSTSCCSIPTMIKGKPLRSEFSFLVLKFMLLEN